MKPEKNDLGLQGRVVRWTNYVIKEPTKPIVHVGIILEHNKSTDQVRVMTQSGVQRWFRWQCEIVV